MIAEPMAGDGDILLRLSVLRLDFRAREAFCFPLGLAGNVVRGAIGKVLHAGNMLEFRGLFAPEQDRGPSGMRNPPRPFVVRARHLDGVQLQPGDHFSFSIHVFVPLETLPEFFSAVASAFRAEFLGTSSPQNVEVPFAPAMSARRAAVCFLSPTELSKDGDRSSGLGFPYLFKRLRDRVGNLRAMYGAGALHISFREWGKRAEAIHTIRCAAKYQELERRSGRTGQIHSLGGFVGEAEYEGPLTEFLPFLEAGRWTGVGRHTVWGNGEIEYKVTAEGEPS